MKSVKFVFFDSCLIDNAGLHQLLRKTLNLTENIHSQILNLSEIKHMIFVMGRTELFVIIYNFLNINSVIFFFLFPFNIVV